MRVLVIGTGAMACLLGARLAPVAEVTLAGTWREGLAALQQQGIVVESVEGTSAPSIPVPAVALDSPLPEADVVLILVKSWQTDAVARRLAAQPTLAPIYVTLQNGLGNWECLTARLGPQQVALGVTTQGATLVGPGCVREGGAGPTYLPDDPRLAPLIPLLQAAHMDVHRVPNPDVQSLVWGKLAINCGINALTALLRVSNGELLQRPAAAQLMESAALECAAVARASGISLPYADPVARVREVARQTARNHSSMFQDILRGARTEVEAINGAVAERGAACQVPTPVNVVLCQLVQALSPAP